MPRRKATAQAEDRTETPNEKVEEKPEAETIAAKGVPASTPEPEQEEARHYHRGR